MWQTVERLNGFSCTFRLRGWVGEAALFPLVGDGRCKDLEVYRGHVVISIDEI
jgi:hypothetical protein